MSNVLVLMSDEHNPLYSEPYGHQRVRTPNMASLASRGVLFENAYCPSPLCLPSRSAFVTGRRVHDIQAYSNCNLLVDPTPQSFGAALSERGVHSAYVGKVDVHAPGDELGFDEMTFPGDRKPPGDTNHRRNPMTIRQGARNRANGYGSGSDAGGKDVKCVDEGVRWLRETAPKLETPWVFVVNVTNPHFPHFAAPEFWDMYPDGGDLPEHGLECETARHPFAESLRKHFETEHFSEEQARGLRRGYLACVSFVDRQLGRLMAALDDAGLSKSTNVVYTSDHGEMLGKFGMWWKCGLFEDSVRIPMIAAGPDFQRGVHVRTPVDSHDLQATLFATTETDQPADWLGEPLPNIPSCDGNRVVFSEYHGHGTPGSSYMIRKGPWKYLHHMGAPPQLFNLTNDPDELVNLTDAETDVVAELKSDLESVCDPQWENDRAERFIKTQLEAIAESGETGKKI